MQSLSVYIDESRNSSSHADRPAFGIIAGLVIPDDALDALNRDIEESLVGERCEKTEAKWSQHCKYANQKQNSEDSFRRAEIILARTFEHALKDERIHIYVSSLNNPAARDFPTGNAEVPEATGCIYKQFMDLHYRFYMHYIARMIANEDWAVRDLKFNFDQLEIGRAATERLNEACGRIGQSLGARLAGAANGAGPSIGMDFMDSADSNAVQFSDLVAGATCAALDDNVYLSDERLALLRQMADGIAGMHARNAPDIETEQDWQHFASDYIDRPDARFMIARPELKLHKTAKNNLKRYVSQLRQQSFALA